MKELEDQAREIDVALKKGGDKERPAGQPSKGKYVGYNLFLQLQSTRKVC